MYFSPVLIIWSARAEASACSDSVGCCSSFGSSWGGAGAGFTSSFEGVSGFAFGASYFNPTRLKMLRIMLWASADGAAWLVPTGTNKDIASVSAPNSNPFLKRLKVFIATSFSLRIPIRCHPESRR